MSSTQAEINQQQQQIPSPPSQQQGQPQYQVKQQSTIYKPPAQLKQVPKQSIFNQKKPELISTTLVSEGQIDPRCNIQKRESLPKSFQYRVTSVDKENLSSIQQNSSQQQQMHTRDRSFERYQNIPQQNLVSIQQQSVSPINQFQISNPTQNANSNQTHQSNNSNYTNQQQNKQLFQQQQAYFSSNNNVQTQQKASIQVGTQSPIPSYQKVSQQQQQQQSQDKVMQQNNPQVTHQISGQIPISVIQDIVKSELKSALQNLKQEEKLEKALKRMQEFDDKWDSQSLKQLIHVESTQTANEVYQFISELKEDFTKKLSKLTDQINLNSESCKSNAFAVSQVSESILNFNKEYLEVTSKLYKQNILQEDKKQFQLQFQGVDEKYNTLVKNIAKQIAESEAKMKKILVEESLKIEKQVQMLTQEINLQNCKKVGIYQEIKAQNQLNSSPEKNIMSQHQHNKSYDSITYLQPNSTRSTGQSVNASLNQNLNEYTSLTRDSVSMDYDQNQNSNAVQLSRNTSQNSEQQIQAVQSPYKQDQYNYTSRNSIQYSRHSHVEQNTPSTTTQNVSIVSPSATIPNKFENYVRKYEDFNKEVDNYLQNRKIPTKVQELMNQSSEMKPQNISDSGYANIIQQTLQSNSLISPRQTIMNRPLITTSPSSVISPPNIDKMQGRILNETEYNHHTNNQLNTFNINQIQQQDLKRINYQSLQQNRKVFEDYSGASVNSSTQISPQRIEQVNLEIDSFNNEIQQSNNKNETRDIKNNSQLFKSNDVISPQKYTENLKFSIIKSQNPQLSMISEQDNEEEELIYQLDDNGFLMDENGGQVKLSGDQIEYLRNQNILEE